MVVGQSLLKIQGSKGVKGKDKRKIQKTESAGKVDPAFLWLTLQLNQLLVLTRICFAFSSSLINGHWMSFLFNFDFEITRVLLAWNNAHKYHS